MRSVEAKIIGRSKLESEAIERMIRRPLKNQINRKSVACSAVYYFDYWNDGSAIFHKPSNII